MGVQDAEERSQQWRRTGLTARSSRLSNTLIKSILFPPVWSVRLSQCSSFNFSQRSTRLRSQLFGGTTVVESGERRGARFRGGGRAKTSGMSLLALSWCLVASDTPCPAGHFRPPHQPQSCFACPVGRHQPLNKTFSSVCALCEPGRVAPMGARLCTVCGAGRYDSSFSR